jgi:hypothetical protein
MGSLGGYRHEGQARGQGQADDRQGLGPGWGGGARGCYRFGLWRRGCRLWFGALFGLRVHRLGQDGIELVGVQRDALGWAGGGFHRLGEQGVGELEFHRLTNRPFLSRLGVLRVRAARFFAIFTS